MSLDEALATLAQGDRSAFDEVYRMTRKTVYYVALSVVRERMLAEDVMQSTYLKVLGNASRYRRGTNAAAWIARIARNEAIDLMRRRAREVSVDERENPLPFGTRDVDDYGLLIDLARRILRREEFSVLMLSAAEGYKRREIAQILSMPLPTVTWHYSRAVKKMQHALREERETPQGGGIVQRRELETELRREAQVHTPDVYERIAAAQPVQGGGEVLALPRRKPYAALACIFAGLVLLLACILPFALRSGAAGNANLYISINPSVEFTVEKNKVTGVRALNRDAAILLADAEGGFIGMTPEDAGAAFAALSEAKHLITQEGIGVYATGEDGEEIARRVRERLAGESAYGVNALTREQLDAILAAYNESAMRDFEDYLERELVHLRGTFSERVKELLASYEGDLAGVAAGSMSQADFNLKYLYLGEDLLLTDGWEREKLLEEFAELEREIDEQGDAYIFDELYDEFLEAIEELYDEASESAQGADGGECDDEDDEDVEDGEDDEDDA